MRWFSSVSGRSGRFVLMGIGLIVLILAGVQFSAIFGNRSTLQAKKEELAKATLIADLGDDLLNGRRILQEEIGMAGSTLPSGIIDKLKENYLLTHEAREEESDDADTKENGEAKDTPKKDDGKETPSDSKASEKLNPTADKITNATAGEASKSDEKNAKAHAEAKPEIKKRLLSTATAAQLRTTLGVDEGTARFILANTDVASWDELAKRKRHLFEENADTIEPLIVARVSRLAAESGIEKIDQFKVEPPKATRRGHTATGTATTAKTAATTQPAGTSGTGDAMAQVQKDVRELKAAVTKQDEKAFITATDNLAQYVAGDTTAQRAARSDIEKDLTGNLSSTQAAQLRLATLRMRPVTMRILSSLYKAHADQILAQFGEGDEEEKPIVIQDEHFPAMPGISRPIQKRALETLSKNPAGWLDDEQLQKIITGEASSEKKPKGEPSQAEAPARNPNNATASKNGKASDSDAKKETSAKSDEKKSPPDSDETRLKAQVRAYQEAVVEALWNLGQAVEGSRPMEGSKYDATLLFKCPLEQLVNFTYKLESEAPWLHVVGLRLTIDNADQPLLSVNMSLEATILKPSSE